jgi:hypothetical protein
MTDQTRRGGASIVALLMVPVLYVLNFGPADYAMKRSGGRGVKTRMSVYAPVVRLHDHPPPREPLGRYEELWTPK